MLGHHSKNALEDAVLSFPLLQRCPTYKVLTLISVLKYTQTMKMLGGTTTWGVDW
jgi:hypothetical protein